MKNKVCFPTTQNLNIRTDAKFRRKEQENHHTGTSVLENLPGLDMIKSFPLDYMHLLCLGVVKKLILNLWLSGKPPYKFSYSQTEQISSRHSNFKNQVPHEFSRKPRLLSDVKRWKATEFRLFLFYTGPVALKELVNPEIYQNFICLHVASIFLSKGVNLKYANELLLYFVQTFMTIYGHDQVSHNIHNLLHIAEDAEKFGNIERFSAFPFENNMLFLKRMLRKGDRPLQQIVKRIEEMKHISQIKSSISVVSTLKIEHSSGPILKNVSGARQFKKVILKDFLLSVDKSDNCCALKDNSIVNIHNILYINVENFFDTPCQSSELHIYLASKSSPLQLWKLSDILHKCVKLHFQNKYVILPLLHTSSSI
nr:unnamed protein product [Callosobruchus analis]